MKALVSILAVFATFTAAGYVDSVIAGKVYPSFNGNAVLIRALISIFVGTLLAYRQK
jgi:hypothetical protein